MYYFKTENLSVGYNKKILIHDINIEIEKGKILTLIGPNGAGKSTILKSITGSLEKINGVVYIGKNEISNWSMKEMAKTVAVVLTDRIRPELMTCAEIVAMGRYPYTNMLGKLTQNDRKIVEESLSRVHALDLADEDFMTLSDGQKQRIMLARAICQEPEVIVLDEPTAYLDIRYKIELLGILREMAEEKKITVIMSLHEIDLATKVSDYILCVKGEEIEGFGTPEELLKEDIIKNLYDIKNGSYDFEFGSVELSKPNGNPKIFVVAGDGKGIPIYRQLQKKNIPFATGILFENDIDCQVAKKLSDNVVIARAFEPINEQQLDEATEVLLKCKYVIDAGTEIRLFNEANKKLLEIASINNIPILKSLNDLGEIK